MYNSSSKKTFDWLSIGTVFNVNLFFSIKWWTCLIVSYSLALCLRNITHSLFAYLMDTEHFHPKWENLGRCQPIVQMAEKPWQLYRCCRVSKLYAEWDNLRNLFPLCEKLSYHCLKCFFLYSHDSTVHIFDRHGHIYAEINLPGWVRGHIFCFCDIYVACS